MEWINVTGNHWRGKATVYKGHETIHRTIYAKTEMGIISVSTRAISPDVAISVATMTFGPVTIPTGEVLSELKTRGSFILVKQGAGWKIAHFQNTIVDSAAEQHDPITWDDTGFLPG